RLCVGLVIANSLIVARLSRLAGWIGARTFAARLRICAAPLPVWLFAVRLLAFAWLASVRLFAVWLLAIRLFVVVGSVRPLLRVATATLAVCAACAGWELILRG